MDYSLPVSTTYISFIDPKKRKVVAFNECRFDVTATSILYIKTEMNESEGERAMLFVLLVISNQSDFCNLIISTFTSRLDLKYCTVQYIICD